MGLAGLLSAVDTTAGAIMFVAIGPMIAAGYLYIRFLIDSENKYHRSNLKYAIWLSFFTALVSAVIQYVASNSTGDLNTKMAKVVNAVDPKQIQHPKEVQNNVIPRAQISIGQVLVNVGVNLLWSFYLWTKVTIFAEQAKS
jgi:predicted permease